MAQAPILLVLRKYVQWSHSKTTSHPSKPPRLTADLSNRPGTGRVLILIFSVPLSPDTAAQNRAVEHGNGQSRACAQSSLIAAAEAQARAVLAMCEALRKVTIICNPISGITKSDGTIYMPDPNAWNHSHRDCSYTDFQWRVGRSVRR